MGGKPGEAAEKCSNNAQERRVRKSPLFRAPIGPPPPISKFRREGDDTGPDLQSQRKPPGPRRTPRRPRSAGSIRAAARRSGGAWGYQGSRSFEKMEDEAKHEAVTTSDELRDVFRASFLRVVAGPGGP